MESIIAKCVSTLCHDAQALGNIWVPVNGRLQTSSICAQWTKDKEGLQFFGERCREMTFERGEGMPGRAWKTGQAEWVPDVQTLEASDYPRLEIAQACGVRASFTVPFVVCGAVLAVLEFVLHEARDEDTRLVEKVQAALTKALSFKVQMGMKRNSTSQHMGLGGMGNGLGGLTMQKSSSEDDLQAQLKYLSRPIQLRAAAEQWAIRRAEVHLGKQLDEGSEGIVFTASWRGMPVAVKTLKTTLSASSLDDCFNEVSVLSHLRHPNLVLFLGACLDDGPLWIMSEFMDGGSVEDFYKQEKDKKKGKPFRPLASQVQRWMTDFARALCFLHNSRPAIIHRDLKPGNLLLTQDGHLKIGDFGLSKIVKGKKLHDQYVMTGRTGTLRYMAPEVMEEESYSETVDIYSYAFNVWFMCTGERPLETYMRQVTNPQKVDQMTLDLKSGLRPEVERIQLPISKLLQKCWDQDPEARPSAQEICDCLPDIKAGLRLTAKAASKKKVDEKHCSLQ